MSGRVVGDGMGVEIHGKERTGAGDELKLRRARSFRKQVGRRSRW